MSQRFLLIQLGDIGDLVLTTPALAALREAQPEAHIALLTTTHSAPVIADTHLVDEIITFDRQQFNNSSAFFRPANLRRIFGLRVGHYDTVIYFHHFTLKAGTLKFALIALAAGARRRIGLENDNGWFLTDRLSDLGFGKSHQAQYWLDLVRLAGADSTPRPAMIAQTEFAGLTQQTSRPQIVIHAGSGGYSLARRWNPVSFAQVADVLHDQLEAEIILVGSPGDNAAAVMAAMQHTPLDLTGKTSLSELAGVIKSADLYIGADSGVMHIAAATGTPIIAIFGPSNAAAYGPWTPQSRSVVVRSAPECSPCSYVGHGVGLREGCPARTCMRMVTAQDVIDHALDMLNDKAANITGNPPEAVPLRPFERLSILSVPVDAVTYSQWLAMIGQWVKSAASARHVCTVNPEFLMIAQHDPNFFNILNRADLCVPDGVGLLWAAKHLGHELPERVTGSDGLPRIAERAAVEGWRLFFLGAGPEVAQKAADVLVERHPALQIVGIYEGSPAPEEEDAIIERINASAADILFVAYGAPVQDKWIARNLPRLQVRMAMGVGGAFDFIAGVIPRAPLWMQQAGLEWLYRLYLQPWRIRRMLRLPRFVIAVLLQRR